MNNFRGHNADLQSQITLLTDILSQNRPIYDVIKKMACFGLRDYYVGAGCITQTIWNYQCGNELTHGISDIDIVYYDSDDLSYEAEDTVIKQIKRALEPCAFELDIKNQARVHIWYKEIWGQDITPYVSVENAINTWPTSSTAIGVRFENNQLKIYAPFGLNDLFGMTVRPNKTQITQEVYLQKVNKWQDKWPLLTIIPW